MTTFSYILIALVVGAFFALALVMRKLSFLSQQLNTAQEELTKNKIDGARALEAAEIALSQKALLENKILALEEKNIVLEKEAIEASTRHQTLKEAISSERESLNNTKEHLSQTFKSLAADVLEGNNKQFLELANSRFEKEQATASGDLEKRQQAIDALLGPLKTKLDQYQKQVGEIEKERQRSYSTVETELKRVVEANSNLASETMALKNALKNLMFVAGGGRFSLKTVLSLPGCQNMQT